MKHLILQKLMLIAVLLTGSHAFAYDFEKDGIYYNITSETDRTVEVTHGGDYYGNKTIPKEVIYNSITYSVTSIGDHAFMRTGLTSVTIPNSVTSIGSSAFSICKNLDRVTIPNSVTSIGSSAFAVCENLDSITIPNSVTSIEKETFASCTNLTSITIPNSVTSIGEEAFYRCLSLTSITIPNSVTSIGEDAFMYCTSLKELRIEDGDSKLSFGRNFSNAVSVPDYQLETIYLGRNLSYTLVTNGDSKRSPFWRLESLKNVIIGNSVTRIGKYLFDHCSNLTSVTIGNSVSSIGEYAFRYCSDLTNVEIPNSVTSIGDYAFSGCYDLTSITIPNSVTSIGDYAFNGCNSFTSITIPNSITIIGDWTFANCGALVSVEISNSVTSIGEDAFLRCTSLTEITCESVMPPTAYSNTFQNVPTTATLYVPAGSKEAYASAEGWSHFTNIVEYDTITGVESSFADDSVAISVENGNIVVNGVADNVNVEVYDVNGQSIYCGTATTIPVAVKGLYIVKVNGKSFKVLL